MTMSIDRYAVMGNPIKHSKSPQIHKAFADQTDQRMTYTSMLVPEAEFEDSVRHFFADGGKGLNITVPFKLRAFELADELTERAQRAKAVSAMFPNISTWMQKRARPYSCVRQSWKMCLIRCTWNRIWSWNFIHANFRFYFKSF